MMWPDLERVLTAARFAAIVEAESKRTLYVQPDQLDRARWLVEQAGADRLVTVRQHPFLAPGMWLLVDEMAVEAGWREAAAGRRPWYRPGGWT